MKEEVAILGLFDQIRPFVEIDAQGNIQAEDSRGQEESESFTDSTEIPVVEPVEIGARDADRLDVSWPYDLHAFE